MNFYAHSLPELTTDKWHLLEEHLENVADKARLFASYFGGGAFASNAGLYHDLGKGTKAWQAYLRHANNVVDEFCDFYVGHPSHSAEGAKLLYGQSKQAGKLLAYCIAGHHGGLPNWSGGQGSALKQKLAAPLEKLAFSFADQHVEDVIPFVPEQDRFGFQIQFFTRMIFSCLVDADFLDTEKFYDQKRSTIRNQYPTIEELHRRFWIAFNKLRENANSQLNVNCQRERVLDDCLSAAKEKPGIFSLTVPTGGGKTLASLAFALNHAREHGKRRIVYVIPFTSIIEQNAQVFKEMLGEDSVLEHHSNFIADDDDQWQKLAAENWDAPLVVTTNVQFFNSFYANRTSQCRKLHNVVDSIVIFDEVQAIPVEKLAPCLEVIKELAKNYGVTPVLCTATQPAIKYSPDFQLGLKVDREIVQNIPELFHNLKRTEENYVGCMDEQEVAEKLTQHDQVLCIVNTRKQALDIFSNLPDSSQNIHLSALMYPAHRAQILEEIRERLASEDERPCRVVSTQLIEAGVDVDFPAVFRAVAGIDSIAQAAGRCNRNGLSNVYGQVIVFSLPEESCCSFFELASQSAKKLFERFTGRLTDPECVREYFEDYFWKNSQRMDFDQVLEDCQLASNGDIQFKDIARFELIQTATIPIVIALEEEARQLVEELNYIENKRYLFRKLQRYTVQIYPYQLEEIRGWLENPTPELWVLRTEELYDQATGLQCSAPWGEGFFG